MMHWEFFEMIVLGLFGLGGFFLKMIFSRLESNGKLLTEGLADQAAMNERIISLFRNYDKLETKVEHLVELQVHRGK